MSIFLFPILGLVGLGGPVAWAQTPVDPTVAMHHYQSEKVIKRPQRMKLIEQAGLERETKQMDELDKDMLVLRAGHQTFASLQRIYPAIPPNKLKNLQLLLEVRK